jgi:hypothetical protein
MCWGHRHAALAGLWDRELLDERVAVLAVVDVHCAVVHDIEPVGGGSARRIRRDAHWRRRSLRLVARNLEGVGRRGILIAQAQADHPRLLLGGGAVGDVEEPGAEITRPVQPGARADRRGTDAAKAHVQPHDRAAGGGDAGARSLERVLLSLRCARKMMPPAVPCPTPTRWNVGLEAAL